MLVDLVKLVPNREPMKEMEVLGEDKTHQLISK